MSTARRRPLLVSLLAALIAFQGISGIAGGVGLVLDPSGRAIGLDPRWLDGSPFPDYLVPGAILMIVLGIVPLVVAIGVLRRREWAWLASLLVGIALIVWIVVEGDRRLHRRAVAPGDLRRARRRRRRARDPAAGSS